MASTSSHGTCWPRPSKFTPCSSVEVTAPATARPCAITDSDQVDTEDVLDVRIGRYETLHVISYLVTRDP